MFKLTIRTPYDQIFNGEVNGVTFASEEGELGVYEDHASLTATLDFSHILVEENNKDETYIGRKGIFLFDNEKNEGTFLLAYCEKESEVDYQTAREYIAFLEQQLEEGNELSNFQVLYLKNERVAVQRMIEDKE